MNDLSRRTVLVVDDAKANVDILVEALKGNYDVSVAMDGESALEIVKSEPPDLILLDIMMPGMDGYEVCRRLKSESQTDGIPIVFLTAIQEVDKKTRGFQLGAVDYITKPFEILEVKARVETHLALKAAREELKNQNIILEENVKERTKKILNLNEELKQSLLNSVRILIGLIEGYDASLGSHSKRTAILALKIGETLGLTQQELFDIEIAALLHDIGTLSIPDKLKFGRLEDFSKEEKALVKQHPIFAQSVLSPSKGFDKAGELIRSHFERIDGSGFPDGMDGEKIPLGSKIIGIANAYDEIKNPINLNGRQVLSGKIQEDLAFHNLEKFAGKYFDAGIIEALKKAVYEIKKRKKNEFQTDISHLRPGLVLSRNLYTIKGCHRLLLSKNNVLNTYHIRRLKAFQKAKLVNKNVFIYES